MHIRHMQRLNHRCFSKSTQDHYHYTDNKWKPKGRTRLKHPSCSSKVWGHRELRLLLLLRELSWQCTSIFGNFSEVSLHSEVQLYLTVRDRLHSKPEQAFHYHTRPKPNTSFHNTLAGSRKNQAQQKQTWLSMLSNMSPWASTKTAISR